LHNYKKYIVLLLFFIFLPGSLLAQLQRNFTRGNISVEYGIWKPGALDEFPTKPFENIPGAKPYKGASLVTPALESFSLQFSYMFWKQDGLETKTSLDFISLQQLSIGLKNYILTQSRICPYVNYGFTAIWSYEDPIGANQQKIKLKRAGYGIDVGAGINIYLISHWAMAAEYSYLYARLDQKVGLTDNYSGPKLAFKLLYLF
jgi:hypothetical protein